MNTCFFSVYHGNPWDIFSGKFNNFVIGQYHLIINSIITQFAKNVPEAPIMHWKKPRVYNGNIVYQLQCLMMMMMNCFQRMVDYKTLLRYLVLDLH